MCHRKEGLDADLVRLQQTLDLVIESLRWERENWSKLVQDYEALHGEAETKAILKQRQARIAEQLSL